MSCAEMKKLLPAMVLGELEGAERDQLVEHLKSCEGCRAERLHLDRVLSVARKLPAPEPSGTRRERVVAAMAASSVDETRVVKPRRSLRSWGLAAAVLLAVTGTYGVATGKFGFAREMYSFKVEDIRGEALLLRAGGATWEPLGIGTAVHIGDRVLTNGGRVWFRSNARDLIVLADGSQVMINREEMTAPGIMLVYGELWAEITPREKGHLRFESPEGEGAAEVIGTKLHVEYR